MILEERRSTGNRNGTIDLFRYIAAALVVALHVTAFRDINPVVSYLLAQVFPRIATPFFFSVAGYYHTCRLRKGNGNTRVYVGKLLITYTIWSVIYVLLKCMYGEDIKANRVLLDYFSFNSAYHFWFFGALVFSTVFLTVLIRFKREKLLILASVGLFLIGCLGKSYYTWGLKIPLFSNWIQSDRWQWFSNVFCMGFPCFSLGYIVFLLKARTPKWKTRDKGLCLLLCVLLYLLEVLLVKWLSWSRSIDITLSLFVLEIILLVYALDDPIPIKPHIAKECRMLATFTYCSHVAFITVFSRAMQHFGIQCIHETAMYILVIASTTLIGLVLMQCKSKTLRRILG